MSTDAVPQDVREKVAKMVLAAVDQDGSNVQYILLRGLSAIGYALPAAGTIVVADSITDAAIAALRACGWGPSGEMRQALTFYRDGFQYHPRRSRTGVNLSEWRPKPQLLDDCGEIARAALSAAPEPPRGGP